MATRTTPADKGIAASQRDAQKAIESKRRKSKPPKEFNVRVCVFEDGTVLIPWAQTWGKPTKYHGNMVVNCIRGNKNKLVQAIKAAVKMGKLVTKK